MNENEIRDALDRLAELNAAKDALALQRQALIDSILNDEIKAKLADIDAEFAPMTEAVTNQANELEGQVREAVVSHGATVKGAHLQAVYSKGRVSWDTKTLDGLMIVIPQLAQARKEGAPSVSIRRMG